MATEAQSLRSQQKGCNWAKIRHLNAFGAGDTVTVGSRTSDKYGRIYDKEMESLSPEYEGCWRYELEFKGVYATAAARRLASSSDVSATAANLVAATYGAWCVPLPQVKISLAAPLSVDKPTSDVERQLKWLRVQVMPTIKKLIAAGHDGEVDEWLKQCYDTLNPF